MLGRRRPLSSTPAPSLRAFPLAYQTYGTLNADKSNAILSAMP